MLDLKTILVPIDFSPRSLAAAEHAVAIGNRFSSKVVFLHVVPLLAYEYAAYESGVYTSTNWPSEAQVQSKLEKEIDAVIEKLAPRGPVEKVVVKGDPPTKIEEMATEHKADLISYRPDPQKGACRSNRRRLSFGQRPASLSRTASDRASVGQSDGDREGSSMGSAMRANWVPSTEVPCQGGTGSPAV